MKNFCTLFDSNYLPRALVMYHSLVATGEDFTLYAVCFDDLAHRILEKLDLPQLVALRLEHFDLSRLLPLRGKRTATEYCWTCTPHVTRFILEGYELPQVTYLDADLFFYDKPSLLLAEMAQMRASVMITPHRYTPRYDQSATSGIYCVQFVTFNHDLRGLRVLEWWQERCLEWCFARFEDGKFGDQKYLDDWPQRFEGVHVLDQVEGGVAPWNVQQYRFDLKSTKLYVNDRPLVFYHFHDYRYYRNGIHDFGGYRLKSDVIDLLYRPYAKELLRTHEEIQSLDGSFQYGWTIPQRSWRDWASYPGRALRGELNRYRVT
jgi:hypothetical protein